MFTYFNQKSRQIADAERRYDACVELENNRNEKSSAFFLRKMQEIIFCRNNGLPTQEKEKNLRIYRDFDVRNK